MANQFEKESFGYDQPQDPEVYRGPPGGQQAGGYSQPSYPPQHGQPAPVMVQPAHHQMTVVNTGAPRPVAAPQNIRDWSTGVCSCFDDVSSCLFAAFCYPCFMCDLAGRLGEHSCGPFCCGVLFETTMRTKVRTMYGIRGTLCNDVCTVCWCGACASCQLKRELDAMDTLQNSVNMAPNVQVTHIQGGNVM